jgi:hypothetical protein
VPLQVVDADERHVEPPGKRLCEAEAHQQRAGQARPVGDGHGVEGRGRRVGLVERRLDDRHDEALVVARGEFGHHPAVFLVEVVLGGHDVRPDRAVLEDGGGRVVAGRFDAEHTHRRGGGRKAGERWS